MKAKHIITVSVLIVVIAVSFVVIRKAIRKKLIARVTERFGDIQGINEKSNAELKQILASGDSK
ncbi:MAG TPA: hypothetical protein PJ995_21555 [Cyclobacteriaceae bacterium]|nr:hypothetical protein [Cyclobacteriaceae bacterium]HMX02938.1 hypothetical protein [Cyclobacteriaceae bacterium]